MAQGGFNFSMPPPAGYNPNISAPPTTYNTQAAAAPAAPAAGNFNFGTATATGFNAPVTAPTPPDAPAPDSSSGQGGATSKFAGLHKNKSRAEESQQKRAQEMLENQKVKRYDFLNHVRKITDLFVEEDEEEDKVEELKWLQIQKDLGDKDATEKLQVIEERKKKKDERKDEIWRFKNQLMHSEWLLEKPADFEEKWVMVPIPQGKRNLVIATGGVTSTYGKTGMCISRFSSHLPGGGRHKHKWNMETSILDCVYNEVTKTYYIMDMMCWRQTPMYDTEAQFRFYWMHEKFLEVPELASTNKSNPYRFEPLPNFRCQPQNLTNVLGCSMSVPMDGILFYHKESHYVFGFTPLVLWIRPHMIPEALGIMVPQKFIDRAPPDYKGFEKHKEQCLQNMQCRDENDRIREKRRQDKRKIKQIEKLKAAGKDYSHLENYFIRSESLSTTGDVKSTESKMET